MLMLEDGKNLTDQRTERSEEAQMTVPLLQVVAEMARVLVQEMKMEPKLILLRLQLKLFLLQ